MERWQRQQKRDLEKTDPTDRLYMALEIFDLSFCPAEVKQVKDLWKCGLHLMDIANQISRAPEEVFALLLDLISNQRIAPRQNGVWGFAQ